MDKALEEDIFRATRLIRDFRSKAIILGLNPKATRVAIKILALIDDHMAATRLSKEEDLEFIAHAQKIAAQAIQDDELERATREV
jgi:hypothetical protein